ncbi:MAG: type II toxin-antitoxin system HipA family toxin [Pseudohongiella sp.]|nr:type II toxin-antitoxin system HipA family toxin [Pseudohongiella sp.]
MKVGLNFGAGVQSVGRLALRERKIYFEYDGAFLKSGPEISPVHLPLRSGLFTFEHTLFEGLAGVFNDSLPDGWGRLLFDRFARSQGIVPTDITPLERLAHVGHQGMGALVYEPDHNTREAIDAVISLDRLAEQAQEVLNGAADEVLRELLALNGSSAGARPKALIGLDATRSTIVHGVHDLAAGYAPWIVKFPNTQDGADAGAIEYVYALMAKDAGINIPDVHLFPAEQGAGYFAIKRFDGDGQKRVHMHTACGLLHSDFRTPSLDYEDLIALTSQLTRDIREVEKMYRLAVFNVLAYNRDDHSKNFSFLMGPDGQWHLSPAYDLTFSSGPRGEQSTMVMGEGRRPGIEQLIQLGEAAKITKVRIREINEQTRAALSQWPTLARLHGVSAANTTLIAGLIV